MDDIDLSVNFLGKRLKAPIIVDSMTGGAPEGREDQWHTRRGRGREGIRDGLGSQRAGLLSEGMAGTYPIVRKNAPTAFIFANIGAAQLRKGLLA